MKNSQIDLSCNWNNRIKKQLSGVFELVFFYLEWKEILEKKTKIFDCF